MKLAVLVTVLTWSSCFPGAGQIPRDGAALQNRGAKPFVFTNELFRISLPEGFTNALTADSAGGRLFLFARPHTRTEGNTVVGIRFPAADAIPKEIKTNERRNAELEGFLEGFLRAKERSFTNLERTKSEEVELDGVTFKALQWSGSAHGKVLQARIWVTHHRGHFISIEAQDLEPHHRKSFSEIEHALKSFVFSGGRR